MKSKITRVARYMSGSRQENKMFTKVKAKKPIILFLSWRDFEHPQSGGAEVFTTEMLRRCQVRNSHRIIHFSTLTNGNKILSRDNKTIYIKKGNWISVLFFAMMFYFSHRKRIQFVVDQCNTHRFFIPFWVPKRKQIFFIHQLTKEIWQIKLPGFMGAIGEFTENIMLKIYSKMATMTVSPSTKKDLEDLGFNENLVKIIPEGVAHKPASFPLEQKQNKNLFLYVGRYSEYKGLPDATNAFVKYLSYNKDAQFMIIGSKNEDYIENVLKPICDRHDIQLADEFNPNNKRTITLMGRVSEEDKLMYMKKAIALIYPSRREGWGLGVSEAAILGTPSIVYNSPGLIDAVDQGRAGYLCKENTSEELLSNMLLVTNNNKKYSELREMAYKYSIQFRWENTALAFDEFIKEKKYA